ncbi:hypothetical protein PIB30_069163 [Stylosanthes scabra]|uniref:Transposase n=1 Tax=Stylosanthes scabra TaxID=79078 RepID=A0ABU6QNS1_9FABA|nr:hypothetical protein [Stylosanthes scabra]
MSYLSSDGRVRNQWFLPWSFADDVLSGVSEEEIIGRYQSDWMPVTNPLRRVFIPINDGGTWFMMLIDIKPWRVYALDVSRTQQSKRRRECWMKKIQRVDGLMLHMDNAGHWICTRHFRLRGNESLEVTKMKVAIALTKTVPNTQRGLVDNKAEMLWRAIKK